jgi:hypothetical protein
MLGWIFRKWDVGVRTGLGWLRIGTGGGRFWVLWGTLGFNRTRGIFLTSCKPVSFSRRTLLHGVSK